MKILITTEPDDNHAVLVKLGLEEEGHDVRLLFMADQPTLLKNSVFIDSLSYHWRSADNYHTVMENDYDVVWWRRARKPHIPKELVHPDDYPFVLRENQFFYESITNNLAPSAWWINPKTSAIRANSKLLQLKTAVECGLLVPVTLCSNEPEDVHHFLFKHERDGVIYKPLTPGIWFEKEGMKLTYTSKINASDLPDAQSLQFSPGIFQKEVKKDFELRIVYFGDEIIAARINSQCHPDGQMDWRAVPDGELAVEPYQLPKEIQQKIKAFMRQMGLVFGSLDFVVTPNGEHVFLEVNEQGQFLWLEDYNDDLPMLDMFIQFILNRSTRFCWNSQRHMHSIEKYRPTYTAIVSENLKRHVDLNSMQYHKE